MSPIDRALNRILKAHEQWYDVQRNYEFAGRVFPGYAEFHARSEQYVLVKRAKLWGANTHEYAFFLVFDHLDAQAYDDLLAFAKEKGMEKVQPEPDHMSSYLTLVVLARSVADDIPSLVRATRFRKNLKLGLRGWVDLRVGVVDFGKRRVCVNAMGRDMRDTLVGNAFAEFDRALESKGVSA